MPAFLKNFAKRPPTRCETQWRIKIVLCVDHVISKECQIMNFVLNFECLFWLFFSWHQNQIRKKYKSILIGCLNSKKIIYLEGAPNFKTNIQYWTPISTFDALSQWHDRHIRLELFFTSILKVAFFQKVRCVFQISKSPKKYIPKNYLEVEI